MHDVVAALKERECLGTQEAVCVRNEADPKHDRHALCHLALDMRDRSMIRSKKALWSLARPRLLELHVNELLAALPRTC